MYFSNLDKNGASTLWRLSSNKKHIQLNYLLTRVFLVNPDSTYDILQ
jgi:hypothetical protein